MRKPDHRKSKLLSLPQAELDALVAWLVDERATYPAVQARLLEKFAVKTSISSLCEFFQRHCTPLILQRGKSSLSAATPVTTPGAAILEIVVELSSPNRVHLKIIPGAGVRVEGGKS